MQLSEISMFSSSTDFVADLSFHNQLVNGRNFLSKFLETGASLGEFRPTSKIRLLATELRCSASGYFLKAVVV